MKQTIEAFGTGATAEEALLNAERELNAPADADVIKEVVDIQEKKILGLFKSGTIYKARACYEVEIKEEKSVKKDESKKSQSKKQVIKEEVKIEGVEADGPAEQYIKSILKGLGLNEVKVFTNIDGDSISFHIISEEDYGCVIGRRGETLDALQYLTRLIVNRTDKEYKCVSVDIGNYREKRIQTLTDLANRNAKKVLKYGRNFTFEPMNPFERRVIHTAVQEIENVESYSIGNDDRRRVVIKLCDGVEPTNPSSKGRSPRRNTSQQNTAQKNTTPKSDVSGASLYGKIEPKVKS